MLPGYPDCARRAAAKSFRFDLEKRGFVLRQTQPSVGAAAGTAVHTAVEHVLRSKIDTGELGSLEPALDAAMAGFDEETGTGCEWDDTTPNRDTAQQQILRMARAYYHGPAQTGEVIAVELELEADAGDGFLLTGHIDRVDRLGSGLEVRDTKTGALVRPYYHQLGAYGLLVRSSPVILVPGTDRNTVSGLSTDFVKRTPKKRVQDLPKSTPYDVGPCERAAWGAITRIKRDLTEFRETGNPDAFQENCMSMMCTPRYCPAFGTDFCELTKGR
jgi:hypothetical protein